MQACIGAVTVWLWGGLGGGREDSHTEAPCVQRGGGAVENRFPLQRFTRAGSRNPAGVGLYPGAATFLPRDFGY